MMIVVLLQLYSLLSKGVSSHVQDTTNHFDSLQTFTSIHFGI